MLDITLRLHPLVIFLFQLLIKRLTWEQLVFENNLKFINRVSQYVHKANRILSVIKHSFCNLDSHIFRLLYISLVRLHLDYASLVWNPYLLKIFGVCAEVCHHIGVMLKEKLHYDCLVSLNLLSLQYQHKLMDMTITYKIIHGLVDMCFSDLFSYIVIQQLNPMVINYSNSLVF